MPKSIAPLTDTKVRTTKPTEKPQKLFDGGGLFLLVTPTGGRLWRFKYRFGGNEKLLNLKRRGARRKHDYSFCFLFLEDGGNFQRPAKKECW